MLALVECVVEVARSRASPLAAALNESTHHGHGRASVSRAAPFSSPAAAAAAAAATGADSPSPPPSAGVGPAHTESQRRAEQLVLYVRALQLLSSALNLSREELRAERLHASASVKQVPWPDPSNHFLQSSTF